MIPVNIEILLDNISLCNQRNLYRDPLDQLDCTSPTNIDPDIYTMDDYVKGVLKGEVGPDANIASWDDEALKAMAVAIRTFGWSRSVDQGGGIYRINTTGQIFFPEKPLGSQEQKYQNVSVSTSGQYLSHPDGEGTAGVITANIVLKMATQLIHVHWGQDRIVQPHPIPVQVCF